MERVKRRPLAARFDRQCQPARLFSKHPARLSVVFRRGREARNALMNTEQQAEQVAKQLDKHLDAYPHLAERVHRQLLIALHTRGIATIDSIQDRAQRMSGHGVRGGTDPNQTERDRWDESARTTAEAIIREYVCKHFTVADVDDLVNLSLKREEVHSLEDVANLASVSFRQHT